MSFLGRIDHLREGGRLCAPPPDLGYASMIIVVVIIIVQPLVFTFCLPVAYMYIHVYTIYTATALSLHSGLTIRKRVKIREVTWFVLKTN